MPAPKMGGYNFRDLMAWLAVSEGEDIDAIQEAIELIFTEQPVEAAKLLREIAHNARLRTKVHTLLQANDVDEARDIFLREIKPALNSGKKD